MLETTSAAVTWSWHLPGATRCIGEEFGLAESTLILATTAARWTLSPNPGTPISPATRAVLVPRAFPVHLSAR